MMPVMMMMPPTGPMPVMMMGGGVPMAAAPQASLKLFLALPDPNGLIPAKFVFLGEEGRSVDFDRPDACTVM